MQEEMYHMSAVNIHMEGQREVGTISGGGEGQTEKEGQGCLLWLGGNWSISSLTEPPPSGCLLVKQLNLFRLKPKEGLRGRGGIGGGGQREVGFLSVK